MGPVEGLPGLTVGTVVGGAALGLPGDTVGPLEGLPAVTVGPTVTGLAGGFPAVTVGAAEGLSGETVVPATSVGGGVVGTDCAGEDVVGGVASAVASEVEDDVGLGLSWAFGAGVEAGAVVRDESRTKIVGVIVGLPGEIVSSDGVGAGTAVGDSTASDGDETSVGTGIILGESKLAAEGDNAPPSLGWVPGTETEAEGKSAERLGLGKAVSPFAWTGAADGVDGDPARESWLAPTAVVEREPEVRSSYSLYISPSLPIDLT